MVSALWSLHGYQRSERAEAVDVVVNLSGVIATPDQDAALEVTVESPAAITLS